MQYFAGNKKQHSYFEGYYFKQQSSKNTVCFIPSFHIDKNGGKFASLQIITNDVSSSLMIPKRDFYASENKLDIHIGDNHFSENGCEINLKTKDVSCVGELKFSSFVEPRYDIMGPFSIVPNMQCRHKVFSLSHKVEGNLSINGKIIKFNDAIGYVEGDSGTSFPKRYFWTHYAWKNNCIMLSVADIPFLGTSFKGCIGILYINGIEYRLATYCGLQIIYIDDKNAIVQQGDIILKVKLIKSESKALAAPNFGEMNRMIYESAACSVRYTLMRENKVIFDFVARNASLESDWKANNLK